MSELKDLVNNAARASGRNSPEKHSNMQSSADSLPSEDGGIPPTFRLYVFEEPPTLADRIRDKLPAWMIFD